MNVPSRCIRRQASPSARRRQPCSSVTSTASAASSTAPGSTTSSPSASSRRRGTSAARPPPRSPSATSSDSAGVWNRQRATAASRTLYAQSRDRFGEADATRGQADMLAGQGNLAEAVGRAPLRRSAGLLSGWRRSLWRDRHHCSRRGSPSNRLDSTRPPPCSAGRSPWQARSNTTSPTPTPRSGWPR